MKKLLYILISVLSTECNMPNSDLRISMTLSDFNSILPFDDPEYLTFNFEERLISPLYKKIESRNDVVKLLQSMTEGQRYFYTFIEIHKEIYNGGVAQFLWNQIELKDYTSKTFGMLGDELLISKYHDLLVDFDMKGSILRDLKIKNDFAKFSECLDSRDFDDLFFGKAIDLQKSMLRYIKENKDQFIKG